MVGLPKIQPTHGFPLGIQRFLELEQKVSDIEKTLDLMRKLVQANNDNLRAILEAIERETNGKTSN